MRAGKKGEKLLTLDRVNRPRVSEMAASQSTGAAATQSSLAKANPEFSEQIRQAQFYNDDKIIVVASANKLYFYQYELPLGEKVKDDVKRLQQRGLYKLL